ncbi:mitochondrial intermembrane space import and assembly protein 40 homolog [Humulus lupulus]|uniref:mitochondrial intermembrane space import and assembly protein 40 homolog n=1 Tax=Humulus lupulus TaxID=3486 RepID=UPI002B407032|nr:mitochondrial intermembrane space import and assembly protein 40 homolog [Humulus lupulus]
MGQVQSDVASVTAASQGRDQTVSSAPKPTSSSSSSSSSMESLLAEAAAYGEEGEEESLDAKAQKALECPCIADLRSGSCGDQFSEAFLCFLKSTAEEKGSDCVHPFVALQKCIKANPDAFSKGILEEDEDEVKKVEEPVQDYKIYPPTWAKEPQSPKSKL